MAAHQRLRRVHSHLTAAAEGTTGTSAGRNWAGFGIGSYGGPGAEPADERQIQPAEHRILFVDDDAVEAMTGLARTLHQPRRCGPVITPEQATQGRFSNVDAYSPPQWNPEKQLWEWWVRADNLEGNSEKFPGAPMLDAPPTPPPLPSTVVRPQGGGGEGEGGGGEGGLGEGGGGEGDGGGGEGGGKHVSSRAYQSQMVWLDHSSSPMGAPTR